MSVDIGKSTRIAMAHHDMTQAELARRVGTSPSTIAQVCRKRYWNLGMVERIASATGFTAAQFIELGESSDG